jgi:hypothetical protein
MDRREDKSRLKATAILFGLAAALVLATGSQASNNLTKFRGKIFVENGGRAVGIGGTFIKVTRSHSNITIKGEEAERSDLKEGTYCEIVADHDRRGELRAKSVTCK